MSGSPAAPRVRKLRVGSRRNLCHFEVQLRQESMSAIDKTCRSISRDLNGSKVPNIVHPFTDQSWVGERQVSGSSQMRLNGRFWGA
jgi:hypothetical protein